jgi:cellulose synthase operon protein C
MMRNRWSTLLWVCATVLALWAPLAQAEPLDDYNSALKFYEQKRWDFAATGFQEFLDKAPTHAKVPLAQLYLGQSLTHSQKYDAARKVFRTFLAAYPKHADAPLAAYRIGESSYFLNDFQAASKELESFVKTYPNHDLAVWGWQYLGETRLQLKDATGAVQAFEVVLKLKTEVAEQIEAKFYLAHAYEALQQGEKAAALYKEVSAANHPRAAEALFGIAETEYRAGRHESSAKVFEELTTRFPKHTLVPTAELNAGYARWQARDYIGAEGHFDRAIPTPTLALTATFWKGVCRESRAEWAGAIEVFEALAAKLPPGELAEKTTYHWADCALRAQRVADAIRLAEEFSTKYPQSDLLPQNELLLGRALLARGDETPAAELTKAQADFQKAAQWFGKVIATKTPSRTHWQARIQLARAEKRLNHPDQVIEALTPLADAIRKAEAGSGDYTDALPMLGEALLNVGKVGEAEGVLNQALQSLPATADRRPTLMKIAELRAVQGHWPEMFQTIDDLAKLDTDGKLLAQSAYANADRAIAKKEWATAQKLLERVVALGESCPQYVSALSDLGTVQAEQGQHAQAAESYRLLLSSATTDAEVLSTASFNRGYCLEQDAKDDPTKLAAAAAALAQGASRFAIPKDKALPDTVEQKVALQASKCARRAAAIHVKLKQMDEADKLWQLTYDQIEKLQPADQERERADALLYEWAGNHFNAGNPARADELFTKLYETHPTSEYADDARLYVAQGHDQAGRVPEARQLYQSLEADATAATQTKQDALLSWMNLEARIENWTESQRIADLIVKSFANTPVAFDARFRLGEAQIQRGDYPNAAQTLTALRSDPALPPVAWRPQLELLWAESQIGLKEYAAVRTALAAFLAAQPDPVLVDQAHEILGRVDLREARFDEARVHLELVTNSPASAKSVLAAKAQLAIADSYLTQIKYDKAIPAYNKVYVNYSLPEFQAPALLQMAACDMAMKQWVNAKMTLDTLIKEFPESPQAKTAAEDLKVVMTHLPAQATP